MSKLNMDHLRECIHNIVAGPSKKERKFLETVELQVMLKVRRRDEVWVGLRSSEGQTIQWLGEAAVHSETEPENLRDL
jgi:hypothetical protein